MLRADRDVTRKTSVSEASKTPYFKVGPTKQLVCPYLHVSDSNRFDAGHSHRFGSESRGHHVDCFATDRLQQVAGSVWSPLENLHLDGSVLLGSYSFTALSIVVHTGLVVFGRVYGISLSKFDPALLSKKIHLPSNKRIIVRVSVGWQCQQQPLHTQTCDILVTNCLLQSTLAPMAFRSVLAIGGKYVNQ